MKPFTLLLAISFAAILNAGEYKLPQKVLTFVETYCLECHDNDTEKGDRSFENFLDQPNLESHHLTLEEILDQLNLGEMPPEKKNVLQPSLEAKREIISTLTQHLKSIQAADQLNLTVMRRLTRMEYNNTMRDLLGIQPDQFDATSLFQFEKEKHGFKKDASVQALSNHQLQEYFNAAKAYLDQAIVFNQERPKTQTWTFKPSDFKASKKIDIRVSFRRLGLNNEHVDIGHGYAVERHPTYLEKFSRHGVPSDGTYKIKVTAKSFGLDHPYGDLVSYDCNKPIEMGLWHVPSADLLQRSSSEGRVYINTFTLKDEYQEHKAQVWMPKGSSPFVHWINGPGASKSTLTKVQRAFHPESEILNKVEIDKLKNKGIEITPAMLKEPDTYLSDLYQGPRVRISKLEIEGPIYKDWPPKSHRLIFGVETNPGKINLQERLVRFASRAFRTKVTQSEIQHYIDYINDLEKQGYAKDEAIKLGMASMLCSPRFLYLNEKSNQPYLTTKERAIRLSYMLWGSMPDNKTKQLVRSKIFAKNLDSEIDRYLSHPHSFEFIKDFCDAWLRLDKIGLMPPSKVQYPHYYTGRLQSAMKQETYLFVEHLLKNNHPIQELIQANYSFINNHLAQHYGIANIQGTNFRKVALPKTSRRNGLLGHASILTATANGIDTSPVLRGIWILESLLGTPPTPPPPDVPPIEPDTRGATTIREQLHKHREVETCADCHANIDPWGFALENFGPIGDLRTHYPLINSTGRIKDRPGPKVDSSGITPKGEKIKDESSLSKILIQREQQLTRNLVQKLLTYATGREMTYLDFPEINSIVEQSLEQKLGLRDLIHQVIKSDIFNRP